MKFQIKINSFITLEEVSDFWTTADYIKLLDLFGFPDAESADKDSLKELLLMAITDHEPNEAAAILLEYKLSDGPEQGTDRPDFKRHAAGQNCRGISGDPPSWYSLSH